MRNLKKILALVLALVMTMSVMSVASAAKAGTTYSDDASITQFDEAVQVLTALGIYRGDDDGFRPNSTITRAEAAALVYRIISKDVNDAQTSIYADYNKFTDVKSTSWYAGYVNFCANGQYIVGNGDGTFNPSGDITGYQLLAIILRSLGYGQNEEYQGTGWEIRTATDAKKLGITANINESTLGQAQTRAAVAEMLFQGLTCTQTVEYNQLLGYTSNASTLTGKTTHGTLGYEKFGLRGYYTASEKDDDVDTTTLVDGYAVSELTTNAPAVADTQLEKVEDVADFLGVTAEDTQSQIVTSSLYGEPVSFWYATSIVSGKNPAGEIEVRYNPVATYSVQNDETVLFAGFSATGTKAAVAATNYNIDGVPADASITLYKTLSDKQVDLESRKVVLDNYGGKGASTELFIADGAKFVVVKNTYVDTVSQAYNTKYMQELTLTNSTLDVTAYKAQPSAIVSGLAKNSVVIFNVYGIDEQVADITTVHTATSKVVTLTNSYVTTDGETNAANCEASYFLVGSTKYEYDCNTLDNALVNGDVGSDTVELLLDRPVLLANDPSTDTQEIFFDDYGYVIYSRAKTSDFDEGYMVVTSVEYGGYDKDNGYYQNIAGYDMEGKSITVKGGFDTYVYGVATDAQDYTYGIGIYHYTKDLDTGFVMLDDNGSVVTDTSSNNGTDAIYAGDPDAVDDTGDNIADNETVFIVANYSAKGAITGYDVYTGIKNIKDLKDANLDEKTGGTVIYNDYLAWTVSYIDNDINPDNLDDDDYADNVIDLVLVLGAKQSSDVKISSSVSTVPEMFYLLDTVPERQFSEYNQYKVIMDGKVTTINVDVDADGGVLADETVLFADGVGFYQVTAWAGDYVFDATKIEAADIEYRGVDVLSISDTASLWAYASCHDGAGEGAFITLADNCKVYDITGGKVVEISAEDLIIDVDSNYYFDEDDAVNELGYTGVVGIAGDFDAYGFATAVYVVNVDAYQG
jgi:hypothetical protein